ncbi:hypothetical protein EV424DRAFT_1326225 [Suillus variegatus]|nr:hypothetical protein EV424DRAFT_1326225 [Suillus variegatus]
MLLIAIQPSAYLFTPRYAANNGELETLRLSRKDVEHGPAELDQARLERKIHLLSFASLSFARVGNDLPHSEVASIVHIELTEWAIDVIRTGLFFNLGKFSQTSQSIHVYRSSARTFEREQWEALEKCLGAWKAGLASVLEVVTTAQERGNGSVVD